MADSPSLTQHEIHRLLKRADRGVGCFIALGDAGLASAAVVVEVAQAGDLTTALETVRQAHEWLLAETRANQQPSERSDRLGQSDNAA